MDAEPEARASLELQSAEEGLLPDEPPETRGAPVSDRWVGPYRVLRRLARGGGATVFVGVAEDGSQVALKVLSAPLSDDESRLRFSREGELLASLDHPCVVGLVGSGLDARSGRPYLALQLVAGRDLDDLLGLRPDERASVPESIYVLERCAQALAAAHAAGIIHRDVKPANLLLTPGGQVRLTDFGLALSDDVSVRLTRDEVLGTPNYMAPEILLGRPWSPAADLYALGACAHRLLLGEPLFAGSSRADILCDHITRVPAELRQLRPDVPQFLSELVARLLAKEPQARPSASEVAALLQPHLPPAESLEALWRDATPPAAGDGEAPLTVEVDLGEGSRFLHYRVDGELGRGGMGIVYRARHMALDRMVALKVLRAGALASEGERRRFLREAQAASGLNHPYVVPVLDAGVHEGTCYLTMDLVEGEGLGAWATRAARHQALGLFARICDGVHHAHTRGVIHRDLKPENILVDGEGAPRILDFGVAKRLDQEGEATASVTREGDVLGTVRYMPPEQAAGRADEVDVRSDVYALGTILYELLAGATPFRGGLREVLHQLHFVEPPPPSSQRPDLPWELDAICLKALEKERDRRYQSALELKQDVERYLAGQPVLARRATAGYRLRKWAARNRAAAVGITAGAVLVLSLLGGWSGTVLLARAEHRSRVLGAVRSGWSALGRGDAAEAVRAFDLAANLTGPEEVVSADADELRAPDLTPGEAVLLSRERLRAWSEQARQRGAALEVERLVEQARAALQAGDYDEASEPLILARRLAPGAAAVQAAAEVLVGHRLRHAREELARLGQEQLDLEQRGEALELARRDLEQALRVDPTHGEAQAALADAHSELGKLAELLEARALRRRELAQAGQLVEDGAARLAAGDLEAARRAYEQALAFDGSDERAQAGLVEVYRRVAEEAEAEEAARRREQVDALREQARQTHEQARARFARGEAPEEVRAAYLAALEALRQALYLDPRHPEAGSDLARLSREFAAVLVDQGHGELSDFILRLAGLEPDSALQTPLPRDPWLALVEADQETVRRSYGGEVVFQPSAALDRLREYVHSQTDRFGFVVEVRSEVVPGASHPQVFAKGLRVRMVDHLAGVVSAPYELPFPAPCLRAVVVDSRGRRLIPPFERARGLDAAAAVRGVEALVQRLLRDNKR